MPQTIPTPFPIGSPPDDPTCILNGYLYLPDPVKYGPGPYPWVVGTRAGGFMAGGPTESNKSFTDWASFGYMGMFFDVRLAAPGQLPGQTTDGKYHQQTDDMKIGIRYARAHPLNNGFVATFGGSGSAHHAIYAAMSGTAGDDRADAAVGLSAPTDFSDRNTDVTQQYINDTTNYGRTTDLPTLLSESPIALVASGIPPIYFSNGTAEAMPYTQFQNFQEALDDIPITNYMARTNTNPNTHAYATWGENSAPAHLFMDNAFALWQSGGTPTKPVPKGLFDLLPAPNGHIGDISSKYFLSNPAMDGCRMRLYWTNIQSVNEATFDTSEIDAALTLCETFGKLVGISFAGGCVTPNWVYTTMPTCTKFGPLAVDDQAVQGFPYLPLIWQASYQSRFANFINHMGSLYDGNPFISYVMMTGFMQDVDLRYITDDADLALADAQAVIDGYADTEAAYVPAAKAIMDMIVAAFPKTSVLLTVDEPFSDTNGRGQRVKGELVTYAQTTYGAKFNTFFNSLIAVLPPHSPPTGPGPAFQPIHASTFMPGIYADPQPVPYPAAPQPLEDCLLNGWSKGAPFLEVYDGDVQSSSSDPNYQQVLIEVHNLLVPSGPPPPVIPVITSPTTASGTAGQPFNYQITATNAPTGYDATPLAGTGLTVDQSLGLISGILLQPGTFTITLSASNGAGTGTEDLVLTVALPMMNRTPILFYPKGGIPPTPLRQPDPPLNVAVQISTNFGTTSGTISWSPPSFDGGSPVTGYVGTVSGGPGTITVDPNSTTGEVTGLASNISYMATMQAVNFYGTSDPSNPASFVTPPATAPPPVTDPRGVYRVLLVGDNGLPIWQGLPFWGYSYIAGSRYVLAWSVLEPVFNKTSRTFVMDDLTAYLNMCDSTGKKAIIEITSGINAPAWFINQASGPSQRYTETGPYPGTMVFPWYNAIYFTSMLQDVLAILAARTSPSIVGLVLTGVGQLAETILANNGTDTATLTSSAATAGFASAVDGWLSAAETFIHTLNLGIQTAYSLIVPELPVPLGTPVKDGMEGLIELDTFAATKIPRRWGYFAYGFTSISNSTTQRIGLVVNRSAFGVAAGYRFIGPSTSPQLDPTQDPAHYVALTGFQNAINNAVTQKAKFIDISPTDADNTDTGYVSAMTNAVTALNGNP